jgi:peptidyl-dipeptidase Dcp
MPKLLLLAGLLSLACPALASGPSAPAKSSNPLLEDWTTPFGVPPFDRIKESHYLPAFKEAVARQRKEVRAITRIEDPPTFANTVEALERSGQLLDRASGVFFGLLSAETNERHQATAKKVAPMLAAMRDDIALDEALFRRVKAVWEARETLDLDPERRMLLKRTYRDFVRGGANLDAKGKKRLRAINSDLSVLGVRFGENVLADTNGYRLVVEKREDLSGLPGSLVAGAADAAEAAGLPGKWVFTLQAPSIWPFLQYADDRELRRQILTAYTHRCDHGDEHDNKAILSKIAALRAEKARLLGYPTYADFVLEENMAGKADKVYALLSRLWTPALAVAKKDEEVLEARIREDGLSFKLEPWDWRYYAEKVKKARYDVDEEAVRPYFELDHVRDGAFYVAGRLYGLSFSERKDIPTYNPEVRAYEVKDADGSHLGVLMLDYHPRPGKRNGAWSGRYRDQWIEDGRDVRPIVNNVANFPRPAGGAPSLLSLEETETLFHEFGHGLHSLMSRCRYRSLSATAVPRDFVELPSQIMENWALEPEVLKVYARHYKTGEPIPDELIAKIKKARQFNEGFNTVEYLAASFLDMDWHTMAGPGERDPIAFEQASLAKIALIPEIVVRYRSPYFTHVFGGSGGYAAGYYGYIWAEVLDADAFQAFKEKGLFDPATARSFRTNILERGGTEEPIVLFKRFRGREPSVEPLLERRGLK